ncbi:MAG TPA: efflux RND transporter periplasmic adaptor subunit [Caulobacteraceae bacterium]|nr:efflux RND transporter periplasmic adaptor subunit [Caulobacteraceae bacterium]
MKTRVIVIAGLVILLGAAVFGYALVRMRGADPAADEDAAPAPSVVSVQVGALERMTLHRYVTGYGEVAPAPATPGRAAAAATIAAPVNGVVTKVLAAEGQQVVRGQLMMELDSDTTTEAFAGREAARQQELYAEHNTSLKALQSAKAQLALLRVVAPVSGAVVQVNVRPGAAVSTSTVLAEVTDLRRLVVQTDIPETQSAELRVGQSVQLLGASPITTRLAYISPTVDASDGAVRAWASLPANSGLRPGQYVDLRIGTATHANALAAPSQSVVTDVDGHSVLSLVRGDEAIRTPVQTGLREGGWVEVAGPGLAAGAPVVTVGAYGLPARTRIHVVKASEDPAGTEDDQPSGTP